MRHFRVVLISGCACMFAFGAPAWAQSPSTGSEPALSASKGQAYPTKPIRFIVPFPAGAPELPSIAEALPGYEVTNWIGIFAPAGTPRDLVSKLNGETVRIMQAPEIRKRLTNEGAKFTPKTPDEFAAFVKSEVAKWAKVVKDAGIRVD